LTPAYALSIFALQNAEHSASHIFSFMAATIRGKSPRAWRRDGRGNRIRYGSFETYGKYTWTVQLGKSMSTAAHA
jgi:hypothetical protein